MILTYDTYRSWLGDELARRLKANPRYSLRAFARDLKLSPGELSEILGGKRPLSHKAAAKIASSLGFTPAEANHLFGLVGSDLARNPAAPATRELSLDLFEVISDTTCLSIIALTDVDGFRWDTKWMAERLGVTAHETKAALDRLKRAGIVEDVKGRLTLKLEHLAAPAGIPSDAVKSYHRQVFDLAKLALDRQPLAEREIAGVSFALDPKHLPAIKREISQFLDHILSRYSKGRKKAVYQLEAAFFRLTEEGVSS